VAFKADVILPAAEDARTVERWVRAALEHVDAALVSFIVIDDRAPDCEAGKGLAHLTLLDPRIRLLRNPARLGFAACCNRGLNESENDAVLLGCDCLFGPGWLRELSAVAHSDERTACASPVAEIWKPSSDCEHDPARAGGRDAPAAWPSLGGLPRFTVTPEVSPSCVYLRRDRLDAIGLLDPRFDSASSALDDWILRARDLGFVAKRANHVSIRVREPQASQDESSLRGKIGAPIGTQRSARPRGEFEAFRQSLEGHLAAHAARVEGTGRLPVAYDLRQLPKEQVGTRSYARSLGKALGVQPEIELTLLVRDEEQAAGLEGRVVLEEDWGDDAAVIHTPAQVLDPVFLRLLFRSSAHVVVTYQDLIGYRTPLAFPTDASFERYRATSGLLLQATQRIIAISRNTAGEISAEFGIPLDEIPVVHHGVEASWFARRGENRQAVRRRARTARPYFFSLTTDFPHKNLPTLLEAYAIVRSRWGAGSPVPELVIAGYTAWTRTGGFSTLTSRVSTKGVRFLGPVPPDRLRALYQKALAYVHPSLYEGFGLTPLEAMAAGTPVIAMPISAVPEVVEDCVLYPDGLSAACLARALETMARDTGLRDELRTRGLAHVEKFRWESSARATLDAYRSAVLRPSERSLRMRRLLRDAILDWSASHAALPHIGQVGTLDAIAAGRSIGIRNACDALGAALRARLGKELRRLGPYPKRRVATLLPSALNGRGPQTAARPQGRVDPGERSAIAGAHQRRAS
jgi:glycosyltransferase involved in cell wall biosynthesis